MDENGQGLAQEAYGEPYIVYNSTLRDPLSTSEETLEAPVLDRSPHAPSLYKVLYKVLWQEWR